MLPPCHHCGDDVTDGEQREADAEGNIYHKTCKKKKEYLGQWQLSSRISPEMEDDLTMKTNDFSRPDLKQIGNSLFEIKSHFMQNASFSVVPTKFESPLSDIKDPFLQRLEDVDCVLHGENVVTHVPLTPNEGTTRGFIFFSESLPMAFNFPSRTRPASVKCDIYLQLPNQPAMVLTFVDGNKTHKDVKIYNTSVHRGIITSISKFLNVSFKTVFGVLNIGDIKDTVLFNAGIETAVKSSKTFVSYDSLSMNLDKYEKVLNAFWASIAETTSVISDSKDNNQQFLHFLTKEQCIILVENINSKEIHITAGQDTGSSTLMLEVARRLSRLDDTLLVVEKAEDIEKLRSVHPDTVTGDELSSAKLSHYKHVVDETNSVKTRLNGRLWTFRKDDDSQEENGRLKERIRKLEAINQRRDERISELVREKEMLRRHLSYIQREDDLLDLKIGLHQSEKTNSSTDLTQGSPVYLDGASPVVDNAEGILKENNSSNGISKPSTCRESVTEDIHVYRRDIPFSLNGLETEIASISYRQDINTVRFIHDFQLGLGRQSDVLDLLRNMALADHQNLKELQCQKTYLEEVVGSPVITIGVDSKPVHVICAKTTFDKDRVNTEYCQVTREGTLTNSPPDKNDEKPHRLRVYLGTITTISFPPSPSSPDPLLHAPRYWECHNRVWLNRKLGKWLTLLDIGITEESQVDKAVWACNQSRSWAFRILGCNVHYPWICAQVYCDKKRVTCFRDIMDNSPESSVRMKFGIVVDPGKGRIAFIDLDRKEIIYKFDGEFVEKLYPAFGVGPWRNEYTVDMTLVSGKDVMWTDAKKDLVYKALK